MLDTEISYFIHTKDNGILLAEYASNSISSLNNVTIGDTATFQIHEYQSDTSLTISNGETYTVSSGETEYWGAITVESNGTLTVNGTLFASSLNVQQGGTVNTNGTVNVSLVVDIVPLLQDFDEFAGQAANLQTLSNTVYYRNQLPSTANISSLIVGVEPGSKLADRDINGVWGIITDVTDTRPQAFTDTSYQIEVLIVDDYPAYADHDSLETTLEM